MRYDCLMSSTIGKRELEHLAKLARIELDPREEEKLLRDLGAILEYFNELQKLDTSAVAPMTGGTDLRNVFREDGASDENAIDSPRSGDERDGGDTTGRENTNQGAGVDAFPESKDGYLKVPPVFE
jgi:aspartyl-tRNA(Asn)/glutamyl-tRNA(Gln) amidotransferase subunit C